MLPIPEFDLAGALRVLLYLAGAFLIALPGAWERERSWRHLGLRTLPLVAITSCALVVVARLELPDDRAQARVVQGLITGIGFLGGGAIVKSGFDVYGTATAATIWLTSGVGIAVGFGRVDAAVVLSVMNFAILRLLSRASDDRPEEKPTREPRQE